jgi:DNA-binding transcriptional MerR regulator
MRHLSKAELAHIERIYAGGIKTSEVVSIFRHRAPFGESALRKYVQLGILPKSMRVGRRGQYRGSNGLYSVQIVRLINDIKKAIDQGITLKEIRLSHIGLSGRISALNAACDAVFEHFRESVSKLTITTKQRAALLQRLDDRQRALREHCDALGAMARRALAIRR